MTKVSIKSVPCAASLITCGWGDNGHVVGLVFRLPSATHANVLGVGAVGATPDAVAAVQQRRLGAVAVDVIQQDETGPLPKRPA